MIEEYPSEVRIRSYHRAFTPETKFYGWHDWKLPKPVTVRFVLYAFCLEVIMLIASFLPAVSTLLKPIPWPVRVGLVGGLAWTLAGARIQGRWFHTELAARMQSWQMPSHLNSWYWGYHEKNESFQFTKVKVRGE